MGSVAIETSALTKCYGANRGVESLDLVVPAGEVFGFLGPNGAGKSTAIRTFMDFHRPTSGRVEVLGLDAQRDSVAVRARVGYLPGDLSLFDRMTAAEHLAWFSAARGGHDVALAATMVDRFEVTMDRPVKELSKGNRQKVGLLLAFAHRPELVILDEPTSGLDPLMQAEFESLLRETTGEGRTVFLSSHSLDEVQRVAHRVAIIREGRLVVTDTVAAMRRSAPRTITLRFAEPGPVVTDAFARLDGVTVTDSSPTTVALALTGDIAPVLTEAVAQGVIDVNSHQADLDDLFRTYYREES